MSGYACAREYAAGSDVEMEFNWPKADGTPADLTGYSIAAYEVAPLLDGFVTWQIVDAATGLVRCRVEWDEAFRGATSALSFKGRLTKAGFDVATFPIYVRYV